MVGRSFFAAGGVLRPDADKTIEARVGTLRRVGGGAVRRRRDAFWMGPATARGALSSFLRSAALTLGSNVFSIQYVTDGFLHITLTISF